MREAKLSEKCRAEGKAGWCRGGLLICLARSLHATAVHPPTYPRLPHHRQTPPGMAVFEISFIESEAVQRESGGGGGGGEPHVPVRPGESTLHG